MFISDNEAARKARKASADLGVSPVSRGAAQTLTFLARTIAAQSVVEIGTGAGVSALALFAGMRRDGILTSIDSQVDHHLTAREMLTNAGIKYQRFRLISGEALSVLPKLADESYDLVFIDADPMEYPEYLEQALRILRRGGIVALYHVLLGGTVADRDNYAEKTLIVRDCLDAIRGLDELTSTLLPLGDGLLAGIKN
jgi:predicted O-methyltransferase YrrM